MLAFGNLGVTSGKVTVQGWLYDVKNQSSPQVLGKQYTDNATNDAVRVIAHRFADEIIFRLGGGIAGIAESKIYFVSEDGPVTVMEPGRELKVLAVNELAGDCMASPAVAGSALFLRTRTHLYRIEGK